MSFVSQFLNEELKQSVDTVTSTTLAEVKLKLVEAMQSGSYFKGGKDIMIIQSAQTPKRLQQIYYSYILAADGKKVIQ